MGNKKILMRALLERYREDIQKLHAQIAANASALAEIEDAARTSRIEVEALRRDFNLHNLWLKEDFSIAVPLY